MRGWRKEEWFRRAKPFIGVVFLQSGLAGMEILSKVAMNQGMSSFVLIVYRHAIATLVMSPFALFLDRKTRPKMTWSIFTKIMLLSLLEPVIDQNMYYLGMKYTSATFAATMCNIIPAITFLMAWVVRLEKVKIKSTRSQAKIVGTLATIAGAMLMTLVKGPVIELFWTKDANHHSAANDGAHTSNNGISLHNSIKGALMIATGCISWSAFVILQAITLETYPAELSLTAWICFLGTCVDIIVTLVIERGRSEVWSIKWDTKLLAVLYSGTVSSGMLYYVQGVVVRERGPVFVTSFSPLSMVIVAIISSFVLSDQLHLGRVVGAVVIVAGLYLVIWGKRKDHYKASSSSSSSLIENDQQEDQEIPQEINKQMTHARSNSTTNITTTTDEENPNNFKKVILSFTPGTGGIAQPHHNN
ncbi:WAT1-related protein At2g37460-like isoform X1 [Malania oleifera]|uniref:WAT1-related protein At2g37460-like isoform X1 n=1 Tax=Malania oleifera TaxID=397392 RepID=UPI0025AE3CBA|nr:WAT1-related protein At2g37460-like isoform X1 [Malania oleifera]